MCDTPSLPSCASPCCTPRSHSAHPHPHPASSSTGVMCWDPAPLRDPWPGRGSGGWQRVASPLGPSSSACLPPEPLQHRRLQPALPRGMSPGREERWGPPGGVPCPAPPGPAAGRILGASPGMQRCAPGRAAPPDRPDTPAVSACLCVCVSSVCLSVSHGATRCHQEPAVRSALGRDRPVRRTRSILGSGSGVGSRVTRCGSGGLGRVLDSSPPKGSGTHCEPDLPWEPAQPRPWSGVWATPGARACGT